MAILRTIDALLTNLENRRMRSHTCERCLEGQGAAYRVYSDELRMNVCGSCADQARGLGLAVRPIRHLGFRKFSRTGVWLPRRFGGGKKTM